MIGSKAQNKPHNLVRWVTGLFTPKLDGANAFLYSGPRPELCR